MGEPRKQAEMITAWANNAELVVFHYDGVDWEEISNPLWAGNQYFACLPKYAEICLHWLKGGDIQRKAGKYWVDSGITTLWSDDHVFMSDRYEFRIKPKKMNMWLGVSPSGETTMAYQTKEELDEYFSHNPDYPKYFQQIQVELET